MRKKAKSQNIILLIVILLLAYTIISFIYYNIRENKWKTEADHFITSIESELPDNTISVMAFVSTPTDSMVYTPLANSLFTPGFITPKSLGIEIRICCADQCSQDDKINYISKARDFCNEYIKTNPQSMFAKTPSLYLEIFSDNANHLNHSDDSTKCLSISFRSYYDKTFDAPKDTNNKLNKLFTSYSQLKMSDLQHFTDCDEISIGCTTDIISHCNFEVFSNLKYLYIWNLDTPKNKVIINKIRNQIDPECIFYIEGNNSSTGTREKTKIEADERD